MQSSMAECRPIITPHRLSMLPAAVLANMVVRQTAALEGLLRGGADGSTSGDRMFDAVAALEDAKRLEQVADNYAAYMRQHGGQGAVITGRNIPKWWAVTRTIQIRDLLSAVAIGASFAILAVGVAIISAPLAWSATL